MGLTAQQRRLRTKKIIIGLIIVVSAIIISIPIIQGMHVPGYATEAPSGSYASLAWEQLAKGQWESGGKPVLPEAISALQGKPVAATGYLLPLHEAKEANQFFLAPKPAGCYFCEPPAMQEVIQVNIADGKKLTLVDSRVTVYGTFAPATGDANDTALYEIDDAVMMMKR